MNKTKTLLILALAAALIVGAVGIGVLVYANSPETVMQSSVQNLFEDVFERQELEAVSSILQSGSLEVIMSLAADDNEVSLEYKEYFGLKNYETYIEKLKFNANDFSIDGSAYVGEDYMYVSVPSLYESPVGLVRGKTEKEFESSIFAFDSDSDFELDEETTDAIKILCRLYDDAQDKKLVADVEEIATSYMTLLMDSIKEHAEIKKENGDVKIHGESVGARIVKIKIDAECIYNVCNDLYEELKDDNRIPKLIKKYGKLADKYVEGTSLEGMLQTELGEDEDDDLIDILLEEYDNLLDDLGDAVDEMGDAVDEADDIKIEIEMATKKTSSTLIAVEVVAKGEGEKIEIANIQLGKNGAKKSDKITVEIMGGEMVYEFAVKQDDKDAYKANITMEAEGEEILNAFVKLDNGAGKFSFGATVEEETYEITGKYEKSGKKHTFDFKDIVYTDAEGVETSLLDEIAAEASEAGVDFELKMIVCESDKPKPLAKGKVKSVFTITEEDIEDLKLAAEEIAAELESVFKVGVGGEDVGVDGGILD